MRAASSVAVASASNVESVAIVLAEVKRGMPGDG
jgi:hypothetical protein